MSSRRPWRTTSSRDHLFRCLVVAQAEIRGVPEVAIVRPLAVAHLRDQLRLDPLHVSLAHARQLRLDRERRRGTVERPQRAKQPRDLGVVEAGADVADVAKLTVLHHTEHERAERPLASTRPAGVADDHELVVVRRLDLQPLARPSARPVGAPGALRDDSLRGRVPGQPGTAPHRRRSRRRTATVRLRASSSLRSRSFRSSNGASTIGSPSTSSRSNT